MYITLFASYNTVFFYSVYRLDHPFSGNSHVVFNGSFFYNVKGTKRILRYNLATKNTISLDLPGDMNRTSKLYSGQYNYVDFCVDENGLWLIFDVPDSNNTAVMKVRYFHNLFLFGKCMIFGFLIMVQFFLWQLLFHLLFLSIIIHWPPLLVKTSQNHIFSYENIQF